MRNFKKILILICVLALLAVGCTVWALADGEGNPGTVADLSDLITTAEKADEETKYDAVKAIYDYLTSHTMDTKEEGYDSCVLRINCVVVEAADIYLSQIPETWDESTDVDALMDTFQKADDLLSLFNIPDGTAGFSSVKVRYDKALYNLCVVLIEEIGTTPDPNTAKNKIKLNRANGILTYCSPYTPNPEIDTIKAQFAECVAAHEKAVAEKLDELDSRNDVSSYDLPIYYTEDWDDNLLGYGVGNLGSGWSFTSNGATANRVGIRQEKNGNKYYVHEYRETKSPAGSFIQRGMSGYKTENGLVFEFKIGTFGEIPKEGILVETGSIEGQFPGPYLSINGNGDICSNNKTTVLLKGALVKGGWLHIIIALDPITFQYNLYVEGEYIGSYSAALPSGASFDHSKVAFRLTGGPSTQGEIAYDDIKIYAGSNYRNPNRLTDMTADEKFVYFVNYFAKETNPILDRKESYDKVTEVIRNYCSINTETGEYTLFPPYVDNEAISNAVATYMAFDIDTLVKEAKINNLESYAALIERFQAVERSSASVIEREGILAEINNFTKVNLNLIDNESDVFTVNADGTITKGANGAIDYDEFIIIFNRVSKQITYDKNADVFTGYMERFARATSLSATQRYYGYAKSYIDDDLIDLNLILVETTPYRENFKKLIEAYEIFVNSQTKVDEVTRINNSKRIVQCVKAISIYRTEEQWEANKDVMVEYLMIVKDAVYSTDANGDPLYDLTYEGIDEAVRFFKRAYEYFYRQMQDEHDEYIGYLLGLISATDDYVEKIGLVALVDRYVDTNDIDLNDARIVKHLSNLETCRSELVLRGEDYSKLLHQNSVYFVNYVDKMRTAKTYAEQVEYYEKATLLYFSLDTTVEGTSAAIEVYDEYNVKLKRIKESSVNFLEAMSIYRACQTPEEKYEALVECYYNAQFAEMSYEGVEAAMAEYQAAYDAYVSYATSVNSDLVETGNAIGSLRVNCGITVIVAIIIKRIFGI